MNKKEIKSRLETLYAQKKLTDSTIKDYEKQLNDIEAEENEKISAEYAKKYQKYVGKIVVISSGTWSKYILKVKEVKPVKRTYKTRDVQFIPDGNIYNYEGDYGKENLSIADKLIIDMESSYHSICELKKLGFYDRRPILLLLLAAQGIDALFTEAEVNRELNEELVLKKK